MAIGKNYPLIKNHFRKHWQERVKVHFDQAGGKSRRRLARVKKAAAIAPRPIDRLRPIVRCPTIKYNRRIRSGKGFTFEEIKAAGLTPKFAATIGISVDHRRNNKSVEGFESNVSRLLEYKSKLIVFPRKAGKPKKGDSKEDIKSAEQIKNISSSFPISQPTPESKPRAVKVGETTAYSTLRKAQSDARYAGIRAKRAKDKADAEAEKKK